MLIETEVFGLFKIVCHKLPEIALIQVHSNFKVAAPCYLLDMGKDQVTLKYEDKTKVEVLKTWASNINMHEVLDFYLSSIRKIESDKYYVRLNLLSEM